MQLLEIIYAIKIGAYASTSGFEHSQLPPVPRLRIQEIRCANHYNHRRRHSNQPSKC